MANSDNKTDTGRVYHTKCTGTALDTVTGHSKDEDITLFGSCFCPFVQRAWIAFEYLGIPYKACRYYFLWIHHRLNNDVCSTVIKFHSLKVVTS